MKYLDAIYDYLPTLTHERPKLILAGDYNICHRPIDIHDPVRNKDMSGFKPEERAWMSKFFDSGYIDSFRHLHPEPHQYSWWSYRANARENNKGWRIDYIATTQNLEKNILTSTMYQDVKHSDHCPVYCEIAV
jgi:exodeoxyribonuclease-3